jgi:DNA-binding response OmpR family regulator
MSDRILIADDEPSNRKILAQELVHKGFVVDMAPGGKEALARVESAPPDLVILDYMMPGLSGLDVLKELRERGNDTPVILITAYGSVERAVEVMKAGAHDFITRPFDPDQIELIVFGQEGRCQRCNGLASGRKRHGEGDSCSLNSPLE